MPQKSLKMPNRLRELLKERNLSYIAFSRYAGSPATIATIINGNHLPGPALRQEIAAALDVSVYDIWPELYAVEYGVSSREGQA